MIEAASSQRHMIVAGILIRDDRVLLCQRTASKEWYPSVWDLPGGHIEEGEAPGAALVRELREELEVSIPEPKSDCLARVRTGEIDMRVWLVTEWTGTAINGAPEEHDELGWFEESEALTLKLAHESYAAMFADAFSRASRNRSL
jgi:8-oxo-dGTP diphosphatase